MSDAFEGKVVLVTGAGSGIGRAAAQLFAARGALVYCAGRQEAKLAQTQALIEEAGGRARVAPADASREEEITALLARIGDEEGRRSPGGRLWR
jgi:NAD(P)-dependent dehydrogenase (short-subunit alcohol dehydrogenase family)